MSGHITLDSTPYQAFEEEKHRRIAAEGGMPAPARTMGPGSKAPPPSHPSLHGHQRTQALLRENDALKAELKAMDGSLKEQLDARLKTYQVQFNAVSTPFQPYFNARLSR